MHPYLLDELNRQHREDLRRTVSPRRGRRPMRRPALPACTAAAAGWRSVADRLLHPHHVPAPSAR